MATIEAEPLRGHKAATTAYDEVFFEQVDREGLASARVIVPLVRQLVECDSVVDIGCGRGAWLRVFLDVGATRVLGYDGTHIDQSKLLIPRSCFHQADLSQPFNIAERFDLAICLEVAEHLPRPMAGPLVKTLCQAAPVVLFSAAIPGQGGTRHINEQWPRYWESLFRIHNYVRLDAIRPLTWRSTEVAWWYRQNVLLYVEKRLLEHSAALLHEYELTQKCPFQLCHSDVLDRYASLRGLIRAVPMATLRMLRRYM
jgi:SAM-dependent methyltransferase